MDRETAKMIAELNIARKGFVSEKEALSRKDQELIKLLNFASEINSDHFSHMERYFKETNKDKFDPVHLLTEITLDGSNQMAQKLVMLICLIQKDKLVLEYFKNDGETAKTMKLIFIGMALERMFR